MPIQAPKRDVLIEFILMTHAVEKCKCSPDDVKFSLGNGLDPKKKHNPYVAGHFHVLNYMMSLIGSPDFPVKDLSVLDGGVFRSSEALSWLREIHNKMTSPLATAAKDQQWEDEINVTAYECGTYRQQDKALAFAYAPPPHLIEPCLHIWLSDLAATHERVKDRLDNPWGLSKNEAFDLQKTSKEACLFLSCLQPFENCSNRVGRVVENAIRLLWRMPLLIINEGLDYEERTRDVLKYQRETMPSHVNRAKQL